MTKFLKTEDGLISERYLIEIDIRPHGLPDAYIKYQCGTRAEQTTATPADVEQFFQQG
jgi:hypothetical protein